MSLLQYFKKRNHVVPDPNGKLAAVIPLKIIIADSNHIGTTQGKEGHTKS